MPGGPGIDAICRLRRQSADRQIVVLTWEHNPGFARAALDGGAVAFVLKDRVSSELTEAVQHAAPDCSVWVPHWPRACKRFAAALVRNDSASVKQKSCD